MPNETNALNKILETALDEAAKEADKNIGSILSEPETPHEFSKEHERKMRKLFNKERNQHRQKHFAKIAKVAACAVAVTVAVSAVSIYNVEAWRIKFLNFVFEKDKPNTRYTFEEFDGTSYSDENVILSYIPEGFELTENNTVDFRSDLYFSIGENYFIFQLSDTETKHSIDTENGTVENIMINGNDGVYVSISRANMVIWHDDKYVYKLTGNLSKEEIFKIATNVKLTKTN